MTLDEVISYNRLFADMETKSGDWEIAEYYRDTVKCLEELKELRELKAEYKRLLKAAVEDFKVIGKVLDADCDILINCEECPLHRAGINCHCWKHQDEALALIGEDTNVPASADDTNVGRKSGGWISCKDNMPDTLERGLSTMYSDCCLVCDAFGWVGMAYYITDGQKSWWEFADAQNQNKIDWTEVTHWMPLPETPKDGEQNG